jgi:hypothetical protein
MRAIGGSSYLTFTYNRFSQDHSSLVVFGHSLSEDTHIVRALLSQPPWNPRRRLAVSIHPSVPDVVKAKLGVHQVLPNRLADVVFFDATTHPMGAPELLIA